MKLLFNPIRLLFNPIQLQARFHVLGAELAWILNPQQQTLFNYYSTLFTYYSTSTTIQFPLLFNPIQLFFNPVQRQARLDALGAELAAAKSALEDTEATPQTPES